MKIFLRLSLLAVTVLVVACSKKSTPASSVGTVKKTDSTTSPAINIALADIAHGKSIFTDNCGKCHRLYQPSEFTRKEWDNILPEMFNKAQVDTSQQRLIRAYVYAGI